MRLKQAIKKMTGHGQNTQGTLNHTQAIAGLMQPCHFKIAIVIHAFHLDKIPEILHYIHNIPYPVELFFTVSPSKHRALLAHLNDLKHPYSITLVANQGYDILPFLELLPSLKKEHYDLVCKIHTKKGAANLEEDINDIENLWFKLLIEPLLGSEMSIRKTIKSFESNPSLGLSGSAELYKSAQALMYGNEQYIHKLLNILQPEADPAQQWGFFAGSMFWARMDIFEPVIENLGVLKEPLTIKTEYTTGTYASPAHAIERIFGLLPKLCHKQVALSYATNIERSQHSLVTIAPNTSPTPVGIRCTLNNEHELLKNYTFLKDNKAFDSDYYLQNTPECKALAMEPVVHFLRYGVAQNYAPNKHFAPVTYWDINPDVYHHGVNPLVHYVLQSPSEPERSAFPAAQNIELIKSIINDSHQFDRAYYLKENPDVASSTMDALEHYCLYGWQENRSPNVHFNVNWYQSEYLNHFMVRVNPLLHYILIGMPRNYTIRPEPQVKLDIKIKNLPLKPKRICLFAAYDPQGVIDESVIIFIKELARFSDVYFLSDATVQAGELDKLTPFVKGAWGIRHGEYDFGSYMRLAKFLVGWDTIAQYDELLLVNDSSYLIRPLDEVFAKMQKKPCAWWGLQATKGMSATMGLEANRFKQKIPIPQVKKQYLSAYAKDEVYDFHIGSYFLAFRRPVLEGGELKKILFGVKKENNKKNIILKYEMGLTQKLIHSGYDFDTFIDALYPFHPLYSNTIFELIKNGYPLFKRFLITENHYHVAELWRWKEKLQALIPDLDTAPIESNLSRVCDEKILQSNLYIKKQPELLTDEEFIKKDRLITKHSNYWVFPVCAYDHSFSGNERAVFEEVKNNPDIKKIILIKSKPVNVTGVNIETLPLHSRAAQEILLQSAIIFIKHTPKVNAIYPLDPARHKFINVWHGIPLKRIGMASLDLQAQKELVIAEHQKCHCVIASSAIDRMAMTAAFYPLTYNDVWVTGLPRNDFILRAENQLPDDYRTQLALLDKILAGRKLILFAPTFRNAQSEGYYHFSATEKTQLFTLLKNHQVVLGIREHMADNAHSYSNELQDTQVINLNSNLFPNIEILYRRAALLITDYSSCFIDFMLTGKPMLCFAYDYQHYMEQERGFFYPLNDVFPGEICYDYQSLKKQLENEVKNMSPQQQTDIPDSYELKRKVFFDYLDDNNAARLVQKIISETVSDLSHKKP